MFDDYDLSPKRNPLLEIKISKRASEDELCETVSQYLKGIKEPEDRTYHLDNNDVIIKTALLHFRKAQHALEVLEWRTFSAIEVRCMIGYLSLKGIDKKDLGCENCRALWLFISVQS